MIQQGLTDTYTDTVSIFYIYIYTNVLFIRWEVIITTQAQKLQHKAD